MIAEHLVLRRRKDGIEVITLEQERPPRGVKDPYFRSVRSYVPVRYVKSGRKGYIKGNVLECDYLVVGQADPDQRWDLKRPADNNASAAAMEALRERDIAKKRKRILEHSFPDYDPSPNALAALDQAIHMILSGI